LRVSHRINLNTVVKRRSHPLALFIHAFFGNIQIIDLLLFLLNDNEISLAISS
jgi:hypothetical protein